MVQAAFGQLSSWDDAAAPSKGADYLNLKENGDYVIRFLNEMPYEFMSHWVELGGKKLTKVKCAGRGCVLCAKGNAAKLNYVSNVLNRATGKCAIYEFGPQIFEQLKRYAKNPRWGDIRKYDICINKEKDRRPNVYIVQAQPPISPLVDDEIAQAREFIKEKGDLNKLSAPLTNEEIRQKLSSLGGGSDLGGDFSAKPSMSKTSAVKEEDTASETDTGLNFDFPDFDKEFG